MIRSVTDAIAENADVPAGEFVMIDGERFYAIRNVDRMAPFFMSIVSDSDHWLFVSSGGGLSAGRVSPQSALFPYIPVDRIHEAAPHTGSKTLLRVHVDGGTQLWEPFSELHQSRHCVSRHLYKNLLGNKLRFEEVNHSLDLTFRYTWTMSDRYGFVRQAELLNTSDARLRVDVLDGLQNLLPAGTPLGVQTNASNLVDAYRWSELDTTTGLALYSEGLGHDSLLYGMFGWVFTLVGGNSHVVHTIHHVGMWWIVIFMIIHIYVAIREDIMSRQSIVSTMISGHRTFKDDLPD